jgi:hypothetical protein
LDRRGTWEVFLDVDSISPGTEFDRVILQTVGRSDIMLALVGPGWVGVGATRLFNPADFMRRELAAGLAAGIPVVPILLRDATLPLASAVPEDLAPLLGRQAFQLRDQTWRADVDRLVRNIEALVSEHQSARAARLTHEVSVGTVPDTATDQRTGDSERAARCCAGSVAWFGAALLASFHSGPSVTVMAGLAGAFNVFLVTASLVSPLRSAIRWSCVVAAGVISSFIWRWFTGYLSFDNGLLCAALVTGFLTVPLEPIRLREAAFRTPHRGWRCAIGAIAWFVAAVVGYFTMRSLTSEDSAIPLAAAGAVGGAVNGFLLGRVAENGRWSWRTGLWLAATAAAGAGVWRVVGSAYQEPFIPAPLMTGLFTGIALARPLPVREGTLIGPTWRGVVGALTCGVIGLVVSLRPDVLPEGSETTVAVATGMFCGVINGVLLSIDAWWKRLAWTIASATIGGVVWGLLQSIYAENFFVYAIAASAIAVIMFHRLQRV